MRKRKKNDGIGALVMTWRQWGSEEEEEKEEEDKKEKEEEDEKNKKMR